MQRDVVKGEDVRAGEPYSTPADAGRDFATSWLPTWGAKDQLAMMADVQILVEQIHRLTQFIASELPNEPRDGQGAVDTAIRVMREQIHSGSVSSSRRMRPPKRRGGHRRE
jgi:hypothetical protein